MLFINRVPYITLLLLCLLLNACASGGNAPVVSPAEARQPKKYGTTRSAQKTRDARPDSYTVKRGDTLYSIAWNYGLDYRHIAAWNSIRSPYTIYPGQRIRLHSIKLKHTAQTRSAAQKKAAPLTPGPVTKKVESKSTAPETKPGTDNTQQARSESLPNIPGPVKWLWPTKGKIVKMDTPISKNGINIVGTEGQNIYAAAPGEVVYSGSGLLGYGRLIIIKHNDTYLSAYAHNKELLVKEGERVNTGQKIALMGKTSAGRTLLHFEIRKNGQPVDPLGYLPKQ